MSRNKDNTKRLNEETLSLKKRIRSLERENAKLRKDIRSGRAFPAPELPEPEIVREKEVIDKVPEIAVKCKCGKAAQILVVSKRGNVCTYVNCPSCGRVKQGKS